MFKRAFIFSLLVAISFSLDESEINPCSFCSILVGNAEKFVGLNDEEIISKLTMVSDTLCTNLPDQIISETECRSFFGLYGPYAVELMASGMKSSEICSYMGLCVADEKYKTLWPSIDQNGITYSIKEDHLNGATQFKYKVFLGDVSSLDDETYTLFTSVQKISGASVTLKLTNNVDSVETQNCDSERDCQMKMPKPGKRIWYYITIDATSSQNGEFSLILTEKNSELPMPTSSTSNSHVIVLVIILALMAICVFCLIVTRCIFARKNPTQQLDFEAGDFVYDNNAELFENPHFLMFSPTTAGSLKFAPQQPVYTQVPVAYL